MVEARFRATRGGFVAARLSYSMASEFGNGRDAQVALAYAFLPRDAF